MSAQQRSVAVIGGGLSGLVNARALAVDGWDVTVFDKGRRPGGRMSTRETAIGLFDHGCQFLTGTDTRFLGALEAWQQANVIKRWNGRRVELNNGQMTEMPQSSPHYVGVTGMQSVCSFLSAGLHVKSGVEIRSLHRTAVGWTPMDDQAEIQGVFDAVVLAVPPLQAAALLDEAPHLARIARAVPMSACWTMMVAFPAPLEFPADAAVIRNSPLGWMARSVCSEAGIPGPDCWVLQATAEWSGEHLDDLKPAVEEALLRSFYVATGCSEQTPMYQASHRWRYALCSQPLAAGCVVDAKLAITLCGDWCLGHNAEAAWLSGLAAASALP